MEKRHPPGENSGRETTPDSDTPDSDAPDSDDAAAARRASIRELLVGPDSGQPYNPAYDRPYNPAYDSNEDADDWAADRPTPTGLDASGPEDPPDPDAGGASARWQAALPHRVHEGTFHETVRRLANAGVTPEVLLDAYADGGDALYRSALEGGDPVNRIPGESTPEWAERHGGPLAVALVAAEVSALQAHLSARAAFVRSRAVRDLLLTWPASSLALDLGVARQKVYRIGRSGKPTDFVATAPWTDREVDGPGE